jgi:hypothetical protein
VPHFEGFSIFQNWREAKLEDFVKSFEESEDTGPKPGV